MDAVLATRGWTPEAFAKATPEFMAAIHHALIAQHFAEPYREIVGVQNTDTKGLTPADRLAFVPRQLEAQRLLPIYRGNLFPEDDDV